MARGGRVSTKHQTSNKVQLKKDGWDESDEDYMVGEDDEFDESEDEYSYHLADDETEDRLGEFEEKKHTKKVKKAGRPRGQRSSRWRNGVKLRNDFGGAKGRKKGIQGGKKDDFVGELRMETSYSSAKIKTDHSNEKPGKETNVSYRGEGKDSDWNDFDEDEDEVFTPDEVYGDEVSPVMKKKEINRPRLREAQSAKRKNQKRKLKNLKTTRRKKPKKKILKRKNRCPVKESRDESSVAQKTKRGTGNDRGIEKLNTSSDSDAAASGFSGYEYTISEEEREQIREAREICKSLTTDLRSLSSLKMIKEEETVPSQRKRPRIKEKEKMVDTKIELGKQVCGICLSEEGKKTVRGILNCCSHYFCFACIMEWSKVESRCPLCKQRFATISKPAQVVGVHSLRDVIFPVPELDQVYQPSEEELRGYLDPYEDVLCTECYQGGDDALMLLCDLCDSPAHTYCVGLGSEVPEGNWYCVVCRPTMLASSNAQALPTPHHGANNNLSDCPSPVVSVRETFDLNELYVPQTPFSQADLPSASPRFSVGYSQAVGSTASGSVALTVYERRRIQQQIHHLILSNRSRQSERSDAMASLSGISHFGSQIHRNEIAHLQDVPSHGTPQNIHEQQGRVPYYATPTPTPTPTYGREVPRASISFSGQVLHHRASTSTNETLCGLLRPEICETSARTGYGLGHQPAQFHPRNSISNTRVSSSFREVRCSSPQKEHVQSMVKSHLKSFSRDLDLGYVTFKKIARSSTHTILAAFRVEHRQNEVYPVETRPLICHHLDRQNSPVAGQCSSCLDWFIRNVVKEVMSIRVLD